VRFGKKRQFRSNAFDLEGSHPNIQIVKSYNAVSKYVRKGNDYIEHGMDAKKEETAAQTKTAMMGSLMLTCDNLNSLAELVNDHPEILPRYHYYAQSF